MVASAQAACLGSEAGRGRNLQRCCPRLVSLAIKFTPLTAPLTPLSVAVRERPDGSDSGLAIAGGVQPQSLADTLSGTHTPLVGSSNLPLATR